MNVLFKEVRTTVSQEAQIVKAVFPNPSGVMQVFLQRVFAQVVCLMFAIGPFASRLQFSDPTAPGKPHLSSLCDINTRCITGAEFMPYNLLRSCR